MTAIQDATVERERSYRGDYLAYYKNTWGEVVVVWGRYIKYTHPCSDCDSYSHRVFGFEKNLYDANTRDV